MGVVDAMIDGNGTDRGSDVVDLTLARRWEVSPPGVGLSRGEQGGADLKVMSLNTLADGLHDTFPRVPQEALAWPVRLKGIIRAIFSVQPAVCCIQEVNHFGEMIDALGDRYVGSFECKVKSPCERLGFPSDGCAILHDTSKLRVVNRDNLVRRLEYGKVGNVVTGNVVQAEYFTSASNKTGEQPELIVFNTHLKAKPAFEDVRVAQVYKLVAFVHEVRERFPTAALMVVGDFNAESDGPAVTLLRESLGLRSAYSALEQGGSDSGDLYYTTCKIREHEVRHVIDYIFFDPRVTKLVDYLRVPELSQLPEHRLPSWSWPSDHFSIVAVLETICGE